MISAGGSAKEFKNGWQKYYLVMATSRSLIEKWRLGFASRLWQSLCVLSSEILEYGS